MNPILMMNGGMSQRSLEKPTTNPTTSSSTAAANSIKQSGEGHCCCDAAATGHSSQANMYQQQQHPQQHGHNNITNTSAAAAAATTTTAAAAASSISINNNNNELLMQHNTESIRRRSQMILDLVSADSSSPSSSSTCNIHPNKAKQPEKRRQHLRAPLHHHQQQVQQQQQAQRDFKAQYGRHGNNKEVAMSSNRGMNINADVVKEEEEEEEDVPPPPPPPYLSDELQRQHNSELIRIHSQMILDLVAGGGVDDPCRPPSAEEQVVQQQYGMHKKLAASSENKASFRQPRRQQAADQVDGGRLKAACSTTRGLEKNDDAAATQCCATAASNTKKLLLQQPQQMDEQNQKHSQMIVNLVTTAADMGSEISKDDAYCTHQKPTCACAQRTLQYSQKGGQVAAAQFQADCSRNVVHHHHHDNHHDHHYDEECDALEVVSGFGTTAPAAAAAYNVNMTTLHHHRNNNRTKDLIRTHSHIILDLVEAADSTPELVQAAVRAASLVLDTNTIHGNDDNDDEQSLNDINTLPYRRDPNEHQCDIENDIIKINVECNDSDESSSTIVASCCSISPSSMYAHAHHTHDDSSWGGSSLIVLADVPQLVDPLEEQERENQVLDALMRKIPHAIPALEKYNSGPGGINDKNDSRGVLYIMTLLPQFLSILFLLAVVVVSSIAVFAGHGYGGTATDATQSAPPINEQPASPRSGSNGTISVSHPPSVVVPAFATPRRPPTVESVMQHGKLRCGVQDFKLAYQPDPETCGVLDDPETCGKKSMEIDLCSAVAAAIFGNAQQYELVEMQIDERFIALNNHTVDLYLRAAPTMERDVHEKTTGAGFSFSVPYGYGTVRFGGHSRFVDCADQRSTIGECADLQVCVIKGSLHTEMLGLPQSYLVERELDGMLSGLLHGPCNVAIGHTADLEKALPLVPNHFDVKLGSRVLASEPVAIATRDDDPMWSDLVNWVLLALVHADDLGITQDMANHFPTTMSFGKGFEHMFQHAISSVGTFLEIRNRYSIGLNNQDIPRDALHLVSSDRELSGALLSPDLGNAHSTVGPDPVANGYMDRMIQRGHFICGITRPRAGFAQQDPATGKWRGLDVDFCRAVSASFFHVKPDDHLKIVDFVDNDIINDNLHEDAFEALADGRVDILSGMSMSLSRDVSEPSSGKGFSFSLPYYYDNEQLGETRALVSRQDDGQWSSFVYWTVACTIYAEELLITQSSSNLMPVVKLYGNHFTRMFRDAILHVGNYGEIYSRNLQAYIPRQGLNMLSSDKIGQQLRTITF